MPVQIYICDLFMYRLSRGNNRFRVLQLATQLACSKSISLLLANFRRAGKIQSYITMLVELL